MKEILNWEDLDINSDQISEGEIKSAEAMGKVPVGKYLCVCAGSTPKEKHFNNYSCFAANLKWQIEEALVVDGKKVDPEEGAMWEGRFIFDEVALQNPDEKDGMRKRRILVAKRCGLISNASEEITKEMWFRDIIGKRATISYIDEKYEDKNGAEKTFRKVAFGGYEYADQVASGMTEANDNFDDI